MITRPVVELRQYTLRQVIPFGELPATRGSEESRILVMLHLTGEPFPVPDREPLASFTTLHAGNNFPARAVIAALIPAGAKVGGELTQHRTSSAGSGDGRGEHTCLPRPSDNLGKAQTSMSFSMRLS
jgi:hypothetical protein